MKTIEVFDLPDDAREMVRECEIRGARTLLTRNGRAVAMLVSYDEFMAMHETIDIANDASLGALLNAAEEEAQRGALEPRSERIHLAASAASAYESLAAHEKEAVDDALRAIDDDPIAGAPLFDPLKGLWCLRAEHVRVIYRIVAEARLIVVLGITRAAAM